MGVSVCQVFSKQHKENEVVIWEIVYSTAMTNYHWLFLLALVSVSETTCRFELPLFSGPMGHFLKTASTIQVYN